MTPKLREVIRRALPALAKARSPHAIGGAVALSTHGIVRETMDLDVFLHEESIYKIFTELRKAGFEIKEAGYMQYWAILPKFAKYLPDYRIDLLVTATPSDTSAIESPVQVKLVGENAKVFPATELAASKFLRAEPKDRQDVERILKLGLTSFFKVYSMLDKETHDDAEEFKVWWGKVREDTIRKLMERRK